MKPWKTLSRSVVLNHSNYLSVEMHTVKLPDGQTISEWPWLITPDYINVLAVTKDKKFLCFKQTKYAVEGVSLAPVGGYIEPGEYPRHAAQRELLEETGYSAPRWVDLGKYTVDGNRGAGVAYLYLALDAHPVAQANADDLEEQELRLLNLAEIESALAANQFKVVAWATVVALSLLHIKREGW